MALQRGPLLLLTLSLGLASAQKTLEEVPVQPGFNAHKVDGRWLTIQLASSRAHLVSPADPLRLGLHSIWTRDENVEFVLFWTGEGVCKGMNVTVHPTGLQGQFQGSLEGGASMHVRFVSTDYSNLVLYVRLEDAGEVTSLWALLGRWRVSPTPAGASAQDLSLGPAVPGALVPAGTARSCTPVGTPPGPPQNRNPPVFTGQTVNEPKGTESHQGSDSGRTTWRRTARRMLGDPTWLGKYLEYVARFQLQKAPVFNLDDGRCAARHGGLSPPMGSGYPFRGHRAAPASPVPLLDFSASDLQKQGRERSPVPCGATGFFGTQL
ncbi:hypothetical protein PANDA_014066 [Ailuropoda melanoleuca]|uniref:Lipocalin/cytosolic fatty-acid binding domain-containing protein n=1 Tax=Ailuropoda melanoleuca TaxID=9646 RepID=D2HQB1_AILME|nr:hypothetical protein PANDA_014066 [Ailuropoda melanoleuca]